MSFFPAIEDDTPASAGSQISGTSPTSGVTADLLELEQFYDAATGGDDADGDADRDADGDHAIEEDGGNAAGDGVVFHDLGLPAVVHEETRVVDTENASVEASVEVSFFFAVAQSPGLCKRWSSFFYLSGHVLLGIRD